MKHQQVGEFIAVLKVDIEFYELKGKDSYFLSSLGRNEQCFNFFK